MHTETGFIFSVLQRPLIIFGVLSNADGVCRKAPKPEVEVNNGE